MSIRTIGMKIFLMLCFWVLSSHALAAEQVGAIKGMAVDAQKKGVEEVDVSIYRNGSPQTPLGTTVTAKDGTFLLKSVPVGKDYVVRAVKRKSFLGVRGEKRGIEINAGKTEDIGEVQLKVPTKRKAA